ncbi:probable aspartic proteinase GIP2 [Macadamia integrifolia]|uniref:probable aspartic proteinase GIP2 n=1 Tax=Macadamia integrifolia TaxID=60698 RepID=UPI001C4F1057|nr:probable aspartic proteinase GIP2 [Macadamia integrifolia]
MAFSLRFMLLLSSLFLASSIADAKHYSSYRPKALVLPISKDASTLQYVTTINQRTPLVSVKVVVDLGGQSLWVDCDHSYHSSSYSPARCHSSQCSLAKSHYCSQCYLAPHFRPGCNNNTCDINVENTLTHTASSGNLGDDVVSIQSTDGSNPGRVVTVSQFLFACDTTTLSQGLAKGAKGIAGLGRSHISLPSQFSAVFSFPKKFAICLSSSTSANGVLFFGDGPYKFLPDVDASSILIYTKLFINPISTSMLYYTGDASVEYFIGVNSIKVNDKAVSLNTSLLSIDSSNGYGGTKISTVDPYTVMETSIYKAVTQAFIEAAASMNITRVSAVSPFGLCFSSKSIHGTRGGAAVPTIDLVLESESVYWRIFGANSMVEVSNDVLCLGFVDGGYNPRTSIVIGGYQLEDNLLQFDVAKSRLGFSSSLLFSETTCANFNFTSTA